jgi:hypothetical protein
MLSPVATPLHTQGPDPVIPAYFPVPPVILFVPIFVNAFPSNKV